MPFRYVLVAILALAVVAVAWSSTAPRSSEAATDLTGSWTFDWNGAPGPYPIPCNTAALKQHGSDLYVYFTCPPGKVFSGTYDKGTGAFTVTTTVLCKGFIEIPLTLTGTVSLDGNSMSGTWSTICISPINGTFDADRSGPPTVTFTPPPSSTPTSTATPTVTSTATATTAPPSPTPTAPPVGGVSVDPPSPAGGDGVPLAVTLAIAGIGSLTALGAAAWALRRAASA